MQNFQLLLAIAQSRLSFSLLIYDQEASPILHSDSVQLPAPESALLQHYLEHTSHDLTVDDGDQYALQIGIPNLALESKPLMGSVLAFSAICKCHDIIKQSSVSCTDRTEILELLSTADRYHMESLREIQPALSRVEYYDHILANAAMMGMYGSGSHCVRIWLTETAAPNDPMLKTFMPKSCQWVSWFRAARVAYEGLVKKKSYADGNGQDVPTPSSVDTAGSSNKQQPDSIDHPLYLILATTMSSAMTKLDEKIDGIARGIINVQTHQQDINGDNEKEPDSHAALDFQACMDALELLKTVITETFPSKCQNLSTSGLYHHIEPDGDSEEQPSNISPWMQRYTANITSMAPSKLPRRFIVAFIHKAPTRYLELVEHMMDFILNEADSSWEPINPEPEPEPTHQLAMEIFAHWLVLALMLDGVWWIGGSGAWELKHIVAAKRNARWRASLWNAEDWWPESMLEIDIQLGKHREKS